jgi:HEAT repeat protein
VVQLNLAADFLMDRGQIPASQAKLEETRLKFLDVNLSDQDRLAALRFLNRGGAVNGEVAVAVAAWLSRGGTPDLTRSILESVRGVKDPALLPATLALAADKEERVRERALRNLGAFAGDPTVESTLWAVAASDASPHVRDRILGMLGDMPMDENRVAALVQRGADETATLQERTLSLRLLANAKADVTSVAAALARNAETVTDKAQFMVCLAAFDDVNNPAFLTAVVRGVQSSDQEVRLRATDTLRDYRGDPTAAQWLTYLAQNDPDPGVREEASRALRPESNRGGGGGNQGRAPGPR